MLGTVFRAWHVLLYLILIAVPWRRHYNYCCDPEEGKEAQRVGDLTQGHTLSSGAGNCSQVVYLPCSETQHYAVPVFIERGLGLLGALHALLFRMFVVKMALLGAINVFAQHWALDWASLCSCVCFEWRFPASIHLLSAVSSVWAGLRHCVPHDKLCAQYVVGLCAQLMFVEWTYGRMIEPGREKDQ